MKINFMIDYLVYLTVKLLSRFFSILPARLALGIARVIGEFLYIFYPNRKNIAYANLLSVFGKSKSISSLKYICKKAFINLSQTVVEVLRIPSIDDRYVGKYIKIVGLDYVKSALDEGKGVVMLTAHFDNWELLAIIGAMIGYPLSILAREQRPKQVNGLLNAYRESKGSKIIKKGFETREIIRVLNDNKPVGILADQDAGKNGVFVNFLGRSTSTPAGPVAFAIKTKAKVLPGFIVREKGPYHRVEMNPPLEFDYTGNKDEAVKKGLQEFSNILSRYIKEHPEQWLWFHKRWKSAPPDTLLILNDGKAGHLNQSRVVAGQIKSILKKSHPEFPLKVKEIKVEFKNRFFALFAGICGASSNRRCAGCLRCMKMCLTRGSYNELIGVYADIIISCGSSLEGVNIIMKRQSNAKNIVIMKPSMVGLGKFDLAIVPEHDRIRELSNVITTKIALNIVDKDLIDKSIDRMRNLGYDFEDKKLKIGILIGGNTKGYTLRKELVDSVLTKILGLARDLDLDLLVTTSRRTSKEIDGLIKQKLGVEERCKLLVIANQKNIEGVVPSILGLSDIVIVSGESISMISEAVSSGRKVVVFIPYGKPCYASKKHKIFLQDLDNKGYITLAYPNDIKSAVKETLGKREIVKRVNDMKVVNEALSNLIL